MKFPTIDMEFDLVVCGAGMSGICAAIQASRAGLKTALINNRGVLGGNASPEIRVHVCGATGTSEYNLYSREGGIIGELLIENRYRNPQGNVYLWHTVLVDALRKEENCSVFLNTYIDTVNMSEDQNGKIISVEGTQSGSEKRFCFSGDTFIDDTGDGTIGYLSGADYMYGREGKETWGENIAPDVADNGVLLSSLSFYSKDFHREMKYTLPQFAGELKEQFQDSLSFREIPDRMPEDARYDGYRFQWYYETGAGRDQMTENEEIIEDHNKLVYNIWDYIKNQSEYDAKQFDLEYISPTPGKRESRRLIGEYILKEQDVAFQTDFEDAVGYGGWSIDLHAAGGFFDNDLVNRHYYLRGIYQVPFRSCCVKKVDNLMVASRCLSVSHVASGTTRLMSTLSLLGQACGTAAAMCKKYDTTPAMIGTDYVEELQETLQWLDQGIVGKKKAPSVINHASVSATSTFGGKLPHTNQWMNMKDELGFVMPVTKENTALKIYVKASEDTVLKCTLYKPAKIENYGPEIKLGQLEIPIEKNGHGMETCIDFGTFEYDKNLFILFNKNEALELEVGDVLINGFRMLEQSINDDDSFVDIATLEPKPYIWKKIDTLPVFEYETNIYAASNLNNGYTRNYGHSNMWLSELGDAQPEVTITFAEPEQLSVVEFTFDNLCDDFDYDTMEHVYESNVWEQVVRDYDICGFVDGTWKVVAEVRGNYQRKNVVSITEGKYSELKIKLYATNGYERFGVYDIGVR